MPPTLVTAHIWILFLKVPILFKLIAKDAFLFRVQILVPWHWHWLMYSAVLVFTYMLLECVSSTTLAVVGLHALSILYVSVGSTQCQAPDVSLPSTRVPCYPSVSCQVVWLLTDVGFWLLPLCCIPGCVLNRPSFTQCDDFWIYLYLWRQPPFRCQCLI